MIATAHRRTSVLTVLFPDLGLDRLRRRERAGLSPAPADGAPRALVVESAHGLRVHRPCARAARIGVRPGQPLADARALAPALHVDVADAAAEAGLLADLADWAQRWTPLVALDGADGLALDVTGSAHLFGGEAALLAEVPARFAAHGFSARAALAPNPVAARAFARAAPGARVGAADLDAALAPLPIAALDIAPEVVAELARLGLSRLADLIARPRAPLARRFGPGLLDRLDQALGRRGAPTSPRLPTEAYVAERRFLDPITHRGDVATVARELAAGLAGLLERHHEGARALELALFRVDGGVVRVTVATSRPTRDPALIADLIGRRLDAMGEGLDVGFGLDVLRLSVTAAGPDAPRQNDLDPHAGEEEAVRRLIDRLDARLGAGRVAAFVPMDGHLPERAAALAAAARLGGAGAGGWPGPTPAGEAAGRPLRLFHPPEPVEALAGVPDGPPLRFRWRRALHEVVRAEGPERIAPEWWRPGAAVLTRDYFRVEDGAGARFWLYRDGLYGRESAGPRWWLHGLFA